MDAGTDHAARTRALATLIVGAAVIGAGPALVRTSEVGPVATAFWRMALAVPALVAARAWVERGRTPRVDDGRAGGLTTLAGVLLASDLAVWHWSIRLTSVANATMMANLAPVVVTLIGLIAFGQRPRAWFLLGLGLAIGGAATLALDSRGIGGARLTGDALGACSAVSYAGYLIAVGRLRRMRGTLAIMLGSSIACAAALLPAAAALEGRLAPHSARGWLGLAALGVVVHAAGQGLIAQSLATLPVAFGSVALLVQPIVAALIAAAAFGEAIGPRQAAGAAMILAGIVVAGRSAAPAGASARPDRRGLRRIEAVADGESGRE